ncbi:hypothetical protein ABIB38_004298 [Massilia sp. UYP11]|uniref:hypothetical protein n=1 Tax=Massilia sp. UYP11 TaxID=1756385 RepID=UPI003D1DB74A
MEYRKISDYDTNMSGSEGNRYELIGCEILAPIDQDDLASLILEHHGYDTFESYQSNDYGREFESEYNSWPEVYNAILQGDAVDTTQHIHDEIFLALHAKGVISNCWVSDLRYYQSKYGDYYISNEAPVRLVDDGKKSYTKNDLIQELMRQGKIVKMAENFYTKT